MTVFKAFLRVLNKNKIMIILYTVILVGISASALKSSDTSTNFVATKPDIAIVNNDKDQKITQDFIKYMTDNCTIIDNLDTDEKMDDSLFYRQVDYCIFIKEGFGEDILNGKVPEIEIKSNGDYSASLAELMVNRYIKVASIYGENIKDEDELINKIKSQS